MPEIVTARPTGTGPRRPEASAGPTVASDAERASASDLETVFSLLHPTVQDVSRERFANGHYADAVEASMKSVNTRVKQIWRSAGHPEKDGKALMLAAFSPNSPVIRLGDLSSETGRNIQEGFMHLFAGAMQGIRNPKAHDNIEIGDHRAKHLLFLASLLMHTLDDAGAA